MNESRSLVSSDVRFQFGKNWSRFLKTIEDERIIIAIQSLKDMLEIEDLDGRRFLDIGSGSGLFSLAARRLGAYVHSFDYDINSVACTAELQRRYFPSDSKWRIEQGSVLDEDYLHSLGKFDIVYAWGVLHHTGEMWQALANASIPVAERGKLYVAIYNDQGGKSRRWRFVKRLYCSNLIGKTIIIGVFFPFFFFKGLIVDILLGRNPMRRYKEHKKNRGMSLFRDWFDWLGGYPFEVAKPEEIFDFYNERGYRLERLKTCGGGLGNNQFVFLKNE